MLTLTKEGGFSLVEILVSLFVVSITAVNITGLQKMVGEQNRDNGAHSAVLALLTEKMEDLLKHDDIALVDELNGKTGEVTQDPALTVFNYTWKVAKLDSALNVGSNIREVQLQMSWNDSKGNLQTFTYSEQVNLNLLLEGGEKQPPPIADIVISLLESNEVIYFEPKMGYKMGAFVIYNSELYEATAVHSVGNGHPRDVDIKDSGWKSYGRIDNPELANNPDLATLFLDL